MSISKTTSTTAMPKPISPTGCCLPFEPEPWDEKEMTWKEKPFLRDHVTCLFHVPLNMGRRIAKDTEAIEAADAATEQPLMLSDEASPWGADIYIEVKKAVPGATMSRLSGTFLTKVFEGPYRNAGKWVAEMQSYVAEKGRQLEHIYFGYTVCPKCAKAYGKNYVVLFAKVADQAAAKSAVA